MKTINLTLPLDSKTIAKLNAGDVVSLSGTIYTARDVAHKRFCETIGNNKELPLDLNTATIFYCGPTPTRKGEIIGSCGPTTSARMDDYTPTLIDNGLRVMIGKGKRSQTVIDAIKKNKCVYFVSIGGAGALTKNCVIKNDTLCYDDLGCEAVYKLEIKNLQVVVGIDSFGNTILK